MTHAPIRRSCRRPLVAAWAALSTVLAGLTLSVATAGPAHARDMDCGDFANQRDAQIYYLNHGGPQSDPDRLDADDDGVACDSNPCPCYSGATPPGGGNSGGGSTGGAGTGDNANHGGKTLRQRARVVRVVDGDTVLVRMHGRRHYVRMVGIDSPEVFGGVECGGPESSAALKRRLHHGDIVRLVSDPTQDRKDRYGRLLRYVVKHGRDMNRRQVRSGNATVYVYDNTPFKRVHGYRTAQRAARAGDRGLWGHC